MNDYNEKKAASQLGAGTADVRPRSPEQTAIHALQEAQARMEHMARRIRELTVKADAYDTLTATIALASGRYGGKRYAEADNNWVFNDAIRGLEAAIFQREHAGPDGEDFDASDIAEPHPGEAWKSGDSVEVPGIPKELETMFDEIFEVAFDRTMFEFLVLQGKKQDTKISGKSALSDDEIREQMAVIAERLASNAPGVDRSGKNTLAPEPTPEDDRSPGSENDLSKGTAHDQPEEYDPA